MDQGQFLAQFCFVQDVLEYGQPAIEIGCFHREPTLFPRELDTYMSTANNLGIVTSMASNGIFEVSSSSYSLVFENILLMKAFNGNSPVDTTVTQYLGAALMNYSEEEFKAKFKFDRPAYSLAMKTIQGKTLPKDNLLAELQKRAALNEINTKDLQEYVNARWESVVKEVQWVIRQLSTESTTGK